MHLNHPGIMIEPSTPSSDDAVAATVGEPVLPAPDASADLAEAVAGIATIVPWAPEGLLAPRLRTPFFAGCVALALGAHVAGMLAPRLLNWSEGAGGRYQQAAGIDAIDTEIIDSRDLASIGGGAGEATPGVPSPMATASIDQAVASAQPAATVTQAATAPEAVAVTEAPSTQAVVEPPADAPAMTPLATPAPAETAVAIVMPPPAFALDTSQPPAAAPAAEPSEVVPKQPVSESQPAQPAPPTPPAASEAAPSQEASTASPAGEGGQAQAVTPTPGNGGKAAATAGELKTYHVRLGARIRPNAPNGGGRRGFVRIAFAVEADGSLTYARVHVSSGNPQLDGRALAAVRRSAPFPKPPSGYVGAQHEFYVPFKFE